MLVAGRDVCYYFLNRPSLREKLPYLEIFWSIFSHFRTQYGHIRSICPYSFRMRENTDQKNSEYGHFSLSAYSR